jgi:hypothetical protein
MRHYDASRDPSVIFCNGCPLGGRGSGGEGAQARCCFGGGLLLPASFISMFSVSEGFGDVDIRCRFWLLFSLCSISTDFASRASESTLSTSVDIVCCDS